MFPLKKVSKVQVMLIEQPKTIVKKTPETEPQKYFNENEVFKQSTVFHSRLGNGEVSKIEDEKLYV